ncbi:uncharacterized protein J5F26_011531 [Ciconia maguari]
MHQVAPGQRLPWEPLNPGSPETRRKDEGGSSGAGDVTGQGLCSPSLCQMLHLPTRLQAGRALQPALNRQPALPSPDGLSLSPGVISFGLLGKIHSVLSNLPVTSGNFTELDLQNSPFPSAFINWLLQTIGVNAGSIP